MPDLVGQRLDTAEATLLAAGFDDIDTDHIVGWVFVVDEDQWVVVAQEPTAGTRVDPGEPVNLGAGPLDDVRTLRALPSDAVLGAEVRQPLAELRAEKEAEEARRAAEEAEEAASEQIDPAEMGLPVDYAPDHGEDLDDQPRPRTLRTDLAEYLVAVREVDPATADGIAPALRVVPAAWCSLWLPEHTGAELDAWVAEADASAAAMAQALGVGYTSSTTPAVAAVMAAARAEAGERFCPEQAARPGEDVDASPEGAGRFSRRDARVRMTDTLMDYYWFSNSWGGEDIAIQRTEIELAYLDLLGQPAQFRSHKWWPVVMECDFYAKVVSGESRDDTVETMLRNNTVFEVHDRAERERTALWQAGFFLDARAGQVVEGC
ncbi:PASTA domain-containing protein [Blastococcus litoris]|uniref:PASTA domain-containing protein n=1 Tax=Blastococcus litoris TaxID=2171622 RepID=UPI001F14646F|nr:PASTA domain-containing protein [Blastococcus litoris]